MFPNKLLEDEVVGILKEILELWKELGNDEKKSFLENARDELKKSVENK